MTPAYIYHQLLTRVGHANVRAAHDTEYLLDIDTERGKVVVPARSTWDKTDTRRIAVAVPIDTNMLYETRRDARDRCIASMN